MNVPKMSHDFVDEETIVDGLERPGPVDDVTGCPSDECQIRRQCTSATGCRRMESEVGRQIAALKRSYDEALAGHEATVEPLKRERDAALRRAEELAAARDAMQREVERFSLLVREARDEADGQRAQVTGLKRQLDEDAKAKLRMLDWLEAIAQAAGSRFQDGPAVVGAIEAVKTERDAACRELSQDRNDVSRTIVAACRDGLARLEHAIDAHPGLCRLTASRAECVISYAACRAQCLVQSTAPHRQMKEIWTVDRTLDEAIERLIADLDEWAKVLAERAT